MSGFSQAYCGEPTLFNHLVLSARVENFSFKESGCPLGYGIGRDILWRSPLGIRLQQHSIPCEQLLGLLAALTVPLIADEPGSPP